MSEQETVYSKDLAGVVVGETAISDVDGEAGLLSYRGIDINDLVGVPYLHVVWMVLFGEWPNEQQKSRLKAFMCKHSKLTHDEIDLPPGTVRLKKGGGHGGHNGLRDIVRHCGADFLRLRLGVGHPGDKDQVTNYVLKRGSNDVETAIERNIDDAIVVMPELVDGDINAAMKKLHTKE